MNTREVVGHTNVKFAHLHMPKNDFRLPTASRLEVGEWLDSGEWLEEFNDFLFGPEEES